MYSMTVTEQDLGTLDKKGPVLETILMKNKSPLPWKFTWCSKMCCTLFNKIHFQIFQVKSSTMVKLFY